MDDLAEDERAGPLWPRSRVGRPTIPAIGSPRDIAARKGVWRAMDNCKRQAWKQHADYTSEGDAKRDQALKQCLEAQNLPPLAAVAR